MLRGFAHTVRLPAFDDLAAIHDNDVVAHVADYSQIVGDEEVGQLELVLQVL